MIMILYIITNLYQVSSTVLGVFFPGNTGNRPSVDCRLFVTLITTCWKEWTGLIYTAINVFIAVLISFSCNHGSPKYPHTTTMYRLMASPFFVFTHGLTICRIFKLHEYGKYKRDINFLWSCITNLYYIQLSTLIDCSSNLNYILHSYYVQLLFMSPTSILLIKYNSKDGLDIVHFVHIKIDTCI